MIEDPAVQPDAPPAGAATSSAGGRPEVGATTVALGQACLSKLVSWLGRLVGLLVGVVWFAWLVRCCQVVVRVYVCWLGAGCCLGASMNNYLVGWLVGVLHVRACVWFGFTMWQATELMVDTMAVMRGFLDDLRGHRCMGKDAPSSSNSSWLRS